MLKYNSTYKDKCLKKIVLLQSGGGKTLLSKQLEDNLKKEGLKPKRFTRRKIVNFNQIYNSTDCIELFGLNNCYCVYRTEIINKKPICREKIKFEFNDNSHEAYYGQFDYYFDYDRAYGGQVQVVGEAITEIGIQRVRGKYWWARMDCRLPQLDNKRVVLQFGKPVAYDDLPDFDGNTVFS